MGEGWSERENSVNRRRCRCEKSSEELRWSGLEDRVMRWIC